MTKTPTAMYTHKISHSPRTQGTDELKHKGGKKDCGVALRQMKRY